VAKKKQSKELQKHWDRVASLGCLISGRPEPTLHHCHGASMKDIGVHRGKGQKPSDWLVIPLHFDFHTGEYGIDSGMGVITWEKRFGSQVSFLDNLSVLLDVNVWRKAGIQRDIVGYATMKDEMTWLESY